MSRNLYAYKVRVWDQLRPIHTGCGMRCGANWYVFPLMLLACSVGTPIHINRSHLLASRCVSHPASCVDWASGPGQHLSLPSCSYRFCLKFLVWFFMKFWRSASFHELKAETRQPSAPSPLGPQDVTNRKRWCCCQGNKPGNHGLDHPSWISQDKSKTMFLLTQSSESRFLRPALLYCYTFW